MRESSQFAQKMNNMDMPSRVELTVKNCIKKGEIMEGMKKRIRRLCGLIGGVCLLFFTTEIYAADCYIEVQLEDLRSPYSDWKGVALALYDVGDVTEYGEVTIDPVYGISEYPQTAEASQKAVAQIEKKLTTDPLMSMKTDADGKLVFSGIDRGVYLIRAEESSQYGFITSSLVHLPYYEIIDDINKGPFFHIKINPKASLPGKPTVPLETTTPKPAGTPDIPGYSGDDVPGSHLSTEKKDGAKTGDESQITGFAVLLGMSAVVVCIVIRRKRKVSE